MSDNTESSGSGEVTFVGGRAIEQTTAGETPEGDHGDEIAAAKAAVKAAMKEEGKTAAREAKEARERDPSIPRDRGADGKFLPNEEDVAREAKAKKADVEPDESASVLRKALQERKETARFKEEAKAELAKMQQETKQFYYQLQREKAELAAEREKLSMLRKDPVRAIKENGWDPEEFIMDLARDGTPEGAAARQQRELQAQIREMQEWKKQEFAARERQKAEYEQNQRRTYRENVEREFLNTSFNSKTDGGADKHPHLSSFYKGHEVGLLAEADVVAEQYRNLTGKEATFGEIAEYLEERAAKWYKSMKGDTQSVSQVIQGRPTTGSATGRKSLSPAGSSERRTLGNHLKDLDGDERLEAAREAVASAIHASGGR